MQQKPVCNIPYALYKDTLEVVSEDGTGTRALGRILDVSKAVLALRIAFG